MIAFVKGTLTDISALGAVVDVGGVGMNLLTSANALKGKKVGDQVQVPTVMVVREDHMTLYGFADANEKDMFLLLQTISGVGPRMALNLISVMGEQKLSNAIANSDIGSLTAVPGIGKKGAQRLILELSDKIASPKNSAITSWRESLITALVGLGWNRKDASSAAEQVPTPENEADLSDSLRTALKILSKTR
ncbi:MAG: Holliday junction branch migration protein RuvA [Candidatus Nanopelagicales bacterium]|nr:Holliday junction branch migration protein RuvA [Candidatus Nanopelagicales bacterium]